MEMSKLVSIPRRSVYAFVNDRNKIIQLFYTKNTLMSMAKNIDEWRDIINKDGLEVRIIENVSGDEDPRLRVSYWYDYYLSQEYKFYKSINGIRYKLKTTIIPFRDEYVFVIYILNKNYNKTLLGGFRNKEEMDGWLLKNYPDQKVYNIKFVDNSLSRQLVRWHGQA